ncbi:VOC family protein [Aestuariibacter sp. A3R04]|uniref:VOC family protein n=1 Tax=Aestuariibacter sp. A3R04 TaxID=2841571 RepID=UPI001C097260|nr:VOC family protein [Aestuariibacter sp. A3R04]MBU3020234.1 VOC family protein [Aestuariibacter sp. A3R04]
MKNKSMNYIEVPSLSLEKTKAFFSSVFNWSFTDYGPEYTAFTLDNIDGGFYHSDKASNAALGAALPVFYSDDLNSIKNEICRAGGQITVNIFAFPGGYRFHFREPGGSEFAVWSENYEETQ